MSEAYNKWLEDPTPDNMSKVVNELNPFLVSEIQQYKGPKDILHVKAKRLAVGAVKSYDPAKGAKLTSWVSTQLKPLSRYSSRLDPVRIPEAVRQRAAELNAKENELRAKLGRDPDDTEVADFTGLSVTRIKDLRQRMPIVRSTSEILDQSSEESESSLPAMPDTAGSDYAFESIYQSLSTRDKQIVDMKTGRHGKKQLQNKEIAARFGITPAAVSQITNDVANRINKVKSYAV
jgi:DNA-directed RNA polymerase specialized sigma subunit